MTDIEGPISETVFYCQHGNHKCRFLEYNIVFECSQPLVVAKQKQRQSGAFKWAYVGNQPIAHPFCPYVKESK